MLKWIFGRRPVLSAVQDGFETAKVEDSARDKAVRSCFGSRFRWEKWVQSSDGERQLFEAGLSSRQQYIGLNLSIRPSTLSETAVYIALDAGECSDREQCIFGLMCCVVEEWRILCFWHSTLCSTTTMTCARLADDHNICSGLP